MKLQNFMLSAMRQTLNKHCVTHKQEILQKLISEKEKVEHQLLWSEKWRRKEMGEVDSLHQKILLFGFIIGSLERIIMCSILLTSY